jgi:hypothetical protein
LATNFQIKENDFLTFDAMRHAAQVCFFSLVTVHFSHKESGVRAALGALLFTVTHGHAVAA